MYMPLIVIGAILVAWSYFEMRGGALTQSAGAFFGLLFYAGLLSTSAGLVWWSFVWASK